MQPPDVVGPAVENGQNGFALLRIQADDDSGDTERRSAEIYASSQQSARSSSRVYFLRFGFVLRSCRRAEAAIDLTALDFAVPSKRPAMRPTRFEVAITYLQVLRMNHGLRHLSGWP